MAGKAFTPLRALYVWGAFLSSSPTPPEHGTALFLLTVKGCPYVVELKPSRWSPCSNAHTKNVRYMHYAQQGALHLLHLGLRVTLGCQIWLVHLYTLVLVSEHPRLLTSKCPKWKLTVACGNFQNMLVSFRNDGHDFLFLLMRFVTFL